MRLPAHNQNSRAFTLIEVMVAVAIFAIVLAAMNSVFFGALKLRTKSAEAVDAALPLEQALAIIRKDLANIVPPGGTFFGQLQTSPMATNTSSSMGANSMLPVTALQGQSSPQFCTSSGVIDDSSVFGDIQRVSYHLVNSTNNGNGRDLFRTVTRNFLPVIQTDVDEQALLSGVENIYFYYHDGTQWKAAWDSTTETLKLPRAIKVQIAMAVEARGRLAPPPIELVAPLIDAGTNDFTQASATQ